MASWVRSAFSTTPAVHHSRKTVGVDNEDRSDAGNGIQPCPNFRVTPRREASDLGQHPGKQRRAAAQCASCCIARVHQGLAQILPDKLFGDGQLEAACRLSVSRQKLGGLWNSLGMGTVRAKKVLPAANTKAEIFTARMAAGLTHLEQHQKS